MLDLLVHNKGLTVLVYLHVTDGFLKDLQLFTFIECLHRLIVLSKIKIVVLLVVYGFEEFGGVCKPNDLVHQRLASADD